ncbi:MAG: hypothetical protein DELT_01589 [Desulfovibrio sp.]
MAEDRSPNKSLIDEISSEVTPATSPLLEFLVAHSRKIAGIAIVCLIGGAGYGIYNWQQKKQVATAQENLGRILVVNNAADRFAKLKTFLADAPAGVKGSVQIAIAKTAAEVGDYAAAHDAWDALSKDPKSSLYVTAMVGKAEALARQDKTKEALAIAESISLPSDSASVPLVQGLIVDLAEKMGDFAKAVAACEKLVTSVAMLNPEEANFWRQKAASLRTQENAAKS